MQDRLILPDGDQAIAIYRGANIPISVGQDRLILPIRARALILAILLILSILLQTRDNY